MIKKIHLTTFTKNYKKCYDTNAYIEGDFLEYYGGFYKTPKVNENSNEYKNLIKSVQTLKANGIKTPCKLNAKTLRTLHINVLKKIIEHNQKQYFNKNGKAIAAGYVWSKWHDIFEAYKNPSEAKARVNYFLREKMKQGNGFGYKILSANCQMFTAAHFYYEKNKLLFRYDTPYSTHIMPGKKMQKLIAGACKW